MQILGIYFAGAQSGHLNEPLEELVCSLGVVGPQGKLLQAASFGPCPEVSDVEHSTGSLLTQKTQS